MGRTAEKVSEPDADRHSIGIAIEVVSECVGLEGIEATASVLTTGKRDLSAASRWVATHRG